MKLANENLDGYGVCFTLLFYSFLKFLNINEGNLSLSFYAG